MKALTIISRKPVPDKLIEDMVAAYRSAKRAAEVKHLPPDMEGWLDDILALEIK